MRKDVVSWDIRITTEIRVHQHAGTAAEGVPQEVFFALSFDGQPPQGTVFFPRRIQSG